MLGARRRRPGRVGDLEGGPARPAVARLPHAQQHHQRDHGGHRRQNIGELRQDEIRDHQLRGGEGDAANGRGGKHAAQALPAAHHQDQVGRDEQRGGRADAAHRRAQTLDGQAGGDRQGGDGNADGAEGHRRGIGQQADAGRVERLESQAHQHGGGHRHRRAESRGAFDERAEGEGDQQRLQTRVVGEVADGILEQIELAALQRHAVEQDGGEDHPADGQQAERRAVGGGGEELSQRHAVDSRGHQRGRAQPHQRGHPGGLAHHAQQDQQGKDGNGRHQRRERQAVRDRRVVLLPHI